VQKVSLSPRSSVENVFKDCKHPPYDNGYPLFGGRSQQSQIPYIITSPPHLADRSDDVSDDDDDDDDEDDVISLSTIPEVPSVMPGTLSPSEYLELGTTLAKKYKRSRKRKPEPAVRDTNDDVGGVPRSGFENTYYNMIFSQISKYRKYHDILSDLFDILDISYLFYLKKVI